MDDVADDYGGRLGRDRGGGGPVVSDVAADSGRYESLRRPEKNYSGRKRRTRRLPSARTTYLLIVGVVKYVLMKARPTRGRRFSRASRTICLSHVFQPRRSGRPGEGNDVCLGRFHDGRGDVGGWQLGRQQSPVYQASSSGLMV